MIVGAVRQGREPVVPILVIPCGGIEPHRADAVVDTGFTGELTLLPDSISRLGYESQGGQEVRLADGELIVLETYRIPVLCHGVRRTITAMQADNDPLIGMALLDGYRLVVDAVEGGAVTIGPIP